MNRRTKIVLALVIVAGASSFLLGRQTTTPAGGTAAPGAMRDDKPCCPYGALCNWLKLSNEQKQAVRAADPRFVGEAQALQQRLQGERDSLAALLETADSSDEQIMAQVERVIEAHDALERRVARHMLAIRPILTPEQTRQFMGLAASGVRDAGRRRLRAGGQGMNGQQGSQGGEGRAGGGARRGRGGGRGRQQGQ